MLCQDPCVTIPSARAGMAHFSMHDSPVLHRMVGAHENKFAGERTLIVVNNPSMQQ